MASLGPYLRDLRERRGLSLEEMARATRVATRYLEALEAEDLRALPAPTFTKGFIRAWCQTAGVDAGEALARYHEVIGQTPITPPGPAPGDDREPPARARSRGTVLVSFVLLVVLGGALFAVTLVLQSSRDRGIRSAGDLAARPVAAVPGAPPAGAAVDPPTAVAPVEPSAAARPPAPGRESKDAARPGLVAPPAGAPAPPSGPAVSASPRSTPALAAAPGVTAPYRLVARAVEPTWLRVRTDDGRETEETLGAGESREWVSDGPFVLSVGNAGGVTLELNGRALPALGARGAVISRLVIPPTGQ